MGYSLMIPRTSFLGMIKDISNLFNTESKDVDSKNAPMFKANPRNVYKIQRPQRKRRRRRAQWHYAIVRISLRVRGVASWLPFVLEG
jgi:hypothetical protein